ncbi:hypothetical protein ZOSMA_44G01140 [Zostera marina]|uniref:Neprosin PEP catalytic domain-containing protein n=1 Tax=Zostera marina TaxID=29655 RepID=A0A0K9P165_ZOSMR|nr:hypothetical protein ZOSMA_44G01140 [Zostera marina]
MPLFTTVHHPTPSFLLLLLPLSLNPFFCVLVLGLSNTTSFSKRVNSLRLERIQRHLGRINKPAVRTFNTYNGDTIDCVPWHKQPSLDHPLLENHKIQRKPPERPIFKEGRSPKNYTGNRVSRGAWQTWHHAGHCPKHTVPIRRSSVQDVLRSQSLYMYGKKKNKKKNSTSKKIDPPPPDVVSGNGHEHAIAYTGTTQEVYGAKASINVWEPSIEESEEFSLSQIWILSGSFDGSDLNSIEAGWQVNPELYGDNSPRLFTYWTSDAYQATGCYNLLCPGFVQTNNKIAIGAAISPVSLSSGDQFDVSILIWKDPRVGNWWMEFGDNNIVGYWPAELFTHLSEHANMVEWGGEVVNMKKQNGAHTSTQMGSGRFAEDGFGKASYFRNLEIVDSDNSLSSVESISTLSENTNCYNIQSYSNSDWGTHFYYGGPGKNPNCP